ncbi:MAG: hypothetical protein CL525_12510 [Aequorivita sp.]|nr:hypothetical protein [Aequorivita sp.]|tara:strand:+ start:1037 stop:1627 length:591 start_codon:yes stop_codon:yes gene_type:complete
MALTLCPRVEDGWQFDFVEDLTLTPTPRDEIDWGELPLEVINLILHFVDVSQVTYWANITSQKSYDCLKGVVKPQEVPVIEYHMNKRLTLNAFKQLQSQREYEVGRDPLEEINRYAYQAGYGPKPDDIWTQEKADNYKYQHQVSQFMLFYGNKLKPYKVKTIKTKKGQVKNKGRQSTRVCSLCGKVGHNKNNRKFH